MRLTKSLTAAPVGRREGVPNPAEKACLSLWRTLVSALAGFHMIYNSIRSKSVMKQPEWLVPMMRDVTYAVYFDSHVKIAIFRGMSQDSEAGSVTGLNLRSSRGLDRRLRALLLADEDPALPDRFGSKAVRMLSSLRPGRRLSRTIPIGSQRPVRQTPEMFQPSL